MAGRPVWHCIGYKRTANLPGVHRLKQTPRDAVYVAKAGCQPQRNAMFIVSSRRLGS